MAYFAEIDNDGVVTRVENVNDTVLIDEDGVSQIQLGINFCNDTYGGTWVHASQHGSIHKNFAAVGLIYNNLINDFIAPKPFESWVLNNETHVWEAPIVRPRDGNVYSWDEENTQWQVIE